MKILLTGATSFTGTWFATELAKAGHRVVAAMRRPREGYGGQKAERIALIDSVCELRWDAPFGSSVFLALIEQEGPFDILCHHASEAKDYKNLNFDATAALANNTDGLCNVLDALKSGGCRRVILTGTVFEEGEGAGETPLAAFSPYGLSKTMTASFFRFYVAKAGMAFGKFVIANPFGPYEEPRFTHYLMRTWKEGKTALVNTPLYVRDNMHVSLLSKVYADFTASLPDHGYHAVNPSGYVEQQGAFARRFADEMRRRLKIDAALEFATQTVFSEPKIRINTDFVDAATYSWKEVDAWDQIARYYAERLSLKSM